MSEQELSKVAGQGVVVETPLRVTDAEAVTWVAEAQVVVVGFGAAGAAAALEANEQGATVLIIDRFEGGGSTAYSGGVYYAGNTKYQRDAGYEDSVQDMFDYLSLERRDAVREETLRRFCEESGANIDWLARQGVGFEGSLYSGKTNYPPEDKYLFFSGNEKVPTFADKAKPMPRGHRAKGKGWTGYAFFDALKKSVDVHGISVRPHSRAIRLVIDGEDRVLGVEVMALTQPKVQKKHQALYKVVDPMRPFNTARAEKAIAEAVSLEETVGKRQCIRARDGLILATGGFAYNVKMLKQHIPFLAERNEALMRLGSLGCNGSGIQLGFSVGGEVAKLDRPFLGRMIAPPNALVQGVMVNRDGKRFVNEDAYNSLLGDAIMQQRDGDAWIIMDKALHKKLLRQCIPTGDGTFKPYLAPTLLNLLFGGTKKGKTIAELANKIGIDPKGLEQTVTDYNEWISRGEPDPMGKNPDYVQPFGKGSYWALNSSIGNKFSFCIFFTLGGLRVDENSGLVLRQDGTVIEGLYAAGRTAMGVPSDGYISGLSIADCVFSGRRAARHAVQKSRVVST